MKNRLLFWLDKIIYGFEDTMPNPEHEPECFKEQKSQIKELKLIRKWVSLLPQKLFANGFGLGEVAEPKAKQNYKN